MGGAFGLLFGTVGLLIAAAGVAMFVFMRRKIAEHRRILREGPRAQAQCLEAYVVRRHSSDGPSRSQRRLIIGFHTADGHPVRATIVSRHPYVVGDLIPVRYAPHRPDRAVADEEATGLAAFSCVFTGVLVVVTCVGLLFAFLGFGTAVLAGMAG